MNIKRILAVLGACLLCLSMAAAETPELTMETFMQANTTQALLNRHSSVALLQTLNDQQVAIWVNRDVRYTASRYSAQAASEGDTESLMTAGQRLIVSYIQFGRGVYPVPILVLDAGLGEPVTYSVDDGYNTDLLYDPDVTARETVQSVTEQAGQLTLTTRLTGQDFIDAWGTQLPEGSYCELVYTLDAETLELQKDTETVLDSAGRPLTEQPFYRRYEGLLQSRQQVLYDTPMPEDTENLLKFLQAYVNPAEGEGRTVTYVFDAGTAGERRVTASVQKGVAVLFEAGDYGYDLYQDPEMTIPAPNDDLESDRTLFVRLTKTMEEETV